MHNNLFMMRNFHKQKKKIEKLKYDDGYTDKEWKVDLLKD